jgi:hypothetical protein
MSMNENYDIEIVAANVGQWEFRILHILITIGNYDYNHGL